MNKESIHSKTSLNREARLTEMSRRDSVFDADKNITSFWGRMKVLWANECFLYLVAAGALRFFGGYSLGFLSANFFEKRYPDYINQFAYMNAVVVVGGGLPASMFGGWLSDKYEDRYGNVKGIIAGVGALTATPFIVVAFTI